MCPNLPVQIKPTKTTVVLISGVIVTSTAVTGLATGGVILLAAGYAFLGTTDVINSQKSLQRERTIKFKFERNLSLAREV